MRIFVPISSHYYGFLQAHFLT